MASNNTPIIQSLLDTDAYKLHMQQAVLHHHRSVQVVYQFICRNKDDHLGCYAAAIQEQVNQMQNLMLTDEEYEYLASLPYFKLDYLHYLRRYRYNPMQVEISVVPLNRESTERTNDGDLVVSIEGPWLETILWETPLLAIISEVTHRARTPTVGVKEAVESLQLKLTDFFNRHSTADLDSFRVSEFGTRRRYSREVHEAVLRTLKEHEYFQKYLIGTSNYDLARRLEIPPIGTQAHEWFQAFQQLCPQLRHSQTMALTTWLSEYPGCLGIALTDCITMDAFLDDFNVEHATTYAGLRQDSGVPEVWGRKAIDHYKRLGIDPKTKTLVFSDGLNLDTAVSLYHTFKDETNVMFGIGTQLTCSIPRIRPLNIVIKMTRCQGRPVAKVSDSPGKVVCEDRSFVEQLLQVFHVNSTPSSLSRVAISV